MSSAVDPGPAEQGAKLLGAARVASGVAFIAMAGPLGRLLIGRDADGAGTQLFIRAFGARDALLGAGILLAIRDGRSARPWLLAAGLADAFDAAATAADYRRLPAWRRALAFIVSAVPAALNLTTARRLGGGGFGVGPDDAGVGEGAAARPALI